MLSHLVIPWNTRADLMHGHCMEKMEHYLLQLGYKPTIYGIGVAAASEFSGYSPAEAASYLALITMAQDIKASCNSPIKMVAFLPHVEVILHCLKNWKNKGLMHPTQWQNDSNAFIKIVIASESQEKWLDMVLSDTVATKETVAKSIYEHEGIKP